jgi:hypothetical protein
MGIKLTPAEKEAAQDLKVQMYHESGHHCYYCPKSKFYRFAEMHMAHIVPKGYVNVLAKTYGPEDAKRIMSHRKIFRLTCARHNDTALMSPAANPEPVKALIEEIKEELGI